jgi:ribosomal protein L37AE/L43A
MDVVSIKCPNCSAPLLFDIASQKWECKFCEAAFTAEQAGSFDRQTDSERQGWGAEAFSEDEAVAYSCPSCGGTVLADKNTAATFCAFCHSPAILAAKLSGEYRPARLIPFRLGRDEVLVSMKRLCKNKHLLPREFRSALEQGEITGLYVPFWLFSADVDVDYRATGKQISKWSSGDYHYTKTDVYRVERELELPYRLVPVDASKRMDDRLMDAIEPFSSDQMIPFTMDYLSGHFAESYDVDSNASAPRFQERAAKGARSAVAETTSGYTVMEQPSLRTFFRHMDCVYVMLPVWTLMTRYKGKTYYLAMNGQTGKSAGKLPVSAARAAVITAALALLATAIIFAGRLLLG